ncbi:unnamed protein product [Moneuplotes crassus]|uniref:Uncharacterized protein n=1 Tax=Euplotes crassus TaxID=5936 RepID=A0AAD1UGB5_EUPCR|nr:unnamed protein product [Moneuplotes crassus]
MYFDAKAVEKEHSERGNIVPAISEEELRENREDSKNFYDSQEENRRSIPSTEEISAENMEEEAQSTEVISSDARNDTNRSKSLPLRKDDYFGPSSNDTE